MKQILPDRYRELSAAELVDRIQTVKRALGPALLILTHHYQRQEVIELGDVRGDSFLLSKKAAKNRDARAIVFCGVHFMAESAAVLARPEQAVFMPDLSAGCPMAEMAPIEQAERAGAELAAIVGPDGVVPVTYVNSSAAVKAFCGRHRGATCTSSNADQIFPWAMSQAERILFLPDEHLGRNTAAKLGIEPVELWDPALPLGGLNPERVRAARVLVWKGYCHVHTAFSVEQIDEQRRRYPGARVVVHPECRREVVAAADASGSTEGIIKYVEAAPPGATVVVGTEINLVERLARLQPGKTVVPLARSLCPNMYRTNLHNLAWVLDTIAASPESAGNRVTVSPEIKRDAALALQRMLDHG
jgi:quinolinate synthase